MRKVLLVILMVLEVISAVYSFFMLIGHSVFWAIFTAAVCILQITLTLSVIINISDIEELRDDVHRLRNRMRHIEDELRGSLEITEPAPALENSETSRGVWECVKCGTVNKSGTSQCGNCGAEYSSWVNPTDTNTKKKLSRLIKYK